MTEAPLDVEQLMSDSVDLANGDYSKLDVLSESYRLHGPGLPEEGIQGREAYRDYLQTVHEAFPDLEYAITDMLATDELVMTEWTITGTHEEEWQGIQPTGRTMEIHTMVQRSLSSQSRE